MTRAGKVSKTSVHYRPASLARPDKRCGSCSMYRAGGICTLVKGSINRLAVCDRWAPIP